MTNLHQLNSAILDQILSKLETLTKTLARTHKTPVGLEMLMACLTYAANISASLGLTQEGFLSLCRQIFDTTQKTLPGNERCE